MTSNVLTLEKQLNRWQLDALHVGPMSLPSVDLSVVMLDLGGQRAYDKTSPVLGCRHLGFDYGMGHKRSAHPVPTFALRQRIAKNYWPKCRAKNRHLH